MILKGWLQKIWVLKRPYEFIDIENDYFLIRFLDVKDYNFVL